MATVGHDFEPYRRWLESCGIDRSRVAQARRRIHGTGLHHDRSRRQPDHRVPPGRDDHSHVNVVPTDAGITLGVVAPDGRDGMVQHAAQFAAAGIPFLFDPGQGLPMFDGAELQAFIDTGTLGRGQRLRRQDAAASAPGTHQRDRARRVEALIVTRGAERQRDPRRRPRIVIPPASRPRSSTRPAAATPTAPGSFTGSCMAATGRRPVASRR